MSPVTEPGILSGERFRSRTELQRHAAQAADGFAELGVQPGDAIAVLAWNDVLCLEVTLAATALGAFAVPINWHGSADETQFVLEDSGAKVLVGHADLVVPIREIVPPGVITLIAETPADIADACGVAPDARAVPPGERDWVQWRDGHSPSAPRNGDQAGARPVLSVIYTSGTTGRPKGVKRAPMGAEQQQAMAKVAVRLLGIGPGSRTLLPSPLYHSAPNAIALFASQLGELLVLPPRFAPEELLALIERHRITCLPIVPAMFVRLLKLPAEVRARYDVSSLQCVSHTAAPCPVETKRQMIEWWGPVIGEYYGSTETGAVTYCSSEEWLAHPGTVGRPLEEATVLVLDEAGNELPPGQIGEVYSSSTALSDFTYHGREDQRSEIEVRGLVTAGDLGYFDEDGFLFICDRKKDMIIFGGTNVYPAEIESVLLQMPGVADCAAFGIPDEDFGEVVAAAVQVDHGSTLDAEEIRDWLKDRVASYKVPRLVEFHDELPREDSGKIFKRRLRDPHWSGQARRI